MMKPSNLMIRAVFALWSFSTLAKASMEVQGGECVAETNTTDSFISIPNFFDLETCQKYREMYLDPKKTRFPGDDLILEGELEVEDDHVEKLISVLHQVNPTASVRELKDLPGYTQLIKSREEESDSTLSFKVKHTRLSRTSELHQDKYTGGDRIGELVEGNNVFVFLNSNPDAEFVYGDSAPVPVVEGTLLMFKGDELHQTKVESGDVHLFGPLNADYFVTVGDMVWPLPEPTPQPSPEPTPQPSPEPTPQPIRRPLPRRKFGFFVWRFFKSFGRFPGAP